MASPSLLNLVTFGVLSIVSMAPGQSPWAVEVISYDPGVAYEDGFDHIDLTMPGDPEKNAPLDRPTVDTYEGPESVPSVTAVPVYPAWDRTEVVSIGGGGHLELKMGVPITNNAHNPYGIDLLVFGNSFFEGVGLYNAKANHPGGYLLADEEGIDVNTKNGVISVSADRETWFYFQNQPRLGVMPTLGRLWIEAEGVWGEPTDPTFPPDPALHMSALSNMTLLDLIKRYRGGAGGTGLDLSNLIVPKGISLPTEFLYVRIDVPEGHFRTEIDAITVVSPVDGYTRWQQKHFAWTRDPADEAPSVTPDADVYSNWLEFALGGDPNQKEGNLASPAISSPDSNTLEVQLSESAAEAPWYIWRTSTLNDSTSWQKLDPQPTHAESIEKGLLIRAYTMPSPEQGVQLYRLQLDGPP
jgi:hypothetical protein